MTRIAAMLTLWFMALMTTAASIAAQESAYLRDDDISGTTVIAEVSYDSRGLYVYKYAIKTASENTGYILNYELDIGCREVPDLHGFDASNFPSKTTESLSLDGKHVPVAIDAPWGQAAVWGISENNGIHWLVGIKPGEEVFGLQIISPYPPGARDYRLVPSADYRWAEWDYSGVMEDDPNLPWLDDWTVTGLTTGPACPGEEYPAGGDDDGDKLFSGTRFPGESAESNELLTYSAPLQDQFHQLEGTREVQMTVHYHATIEPRTFRVTPEKHQLRRLFNPRPGTSETVRIPLDPGKNRIELQIQSRAVPPGQADKPAQEVRGRDSVSMDRDVFVIRVPASGAPGKANKGQ